MIMSPTRQRPYRPARLQRGMFLIECLVAILLFAIGVLGIVGLNAFAVAAQSDAQYRGEAANLANRITQEAWLNVDRMTGATPLARATALRTALETFRHQPSGDDCSYSGGAATAPVMTGWIADARKLPGATAAMQQVLVDTDAATGFNKVTVTVCWQVPANPVPRRHVFAAFVN